MKGISLLLLLICSVSSTSIGDGNTDLFMLASWYSASAYCDASKITDWSCLACNEPTVKGFEVVQVFENATSDQQAYIGVDAIHSTIVLAFRGTIDLSNWVTDMEIAKCNFSLPFGPDNGERVHYGFYSAWVSLKPAIFAAIKSLGDKYPAYQFLVTGHSLGAAIATLAAADIAANSAASPILVNFGSPRVGNSIFSTSLSKYGVSQHFRITHWKDEVPHVPPQIFGFHHIPQEVFQQKYYMGPQSLTYCDDTGEDPTCIDQFNLEVWDLYGEHCTYLNHSICTNACASFTGPPPGSLKHRSHVF